MACRRIFNLIFKKNRPILFGMASPFIQYDPSKKPNSEEKINLEPPDAKDLSFDYMIRQSSIETVNSASQTLTITYIAIEAASQEYRKLLAKLITLLQESLMRKVEDEHWDAIVIIRSAMQKKKQTIARLIGYMEYVQKMAVATSEVSFLSGMDNLSNTLCQRIDDAINNIQKEMVHNQRMEDEYTLIQQKCILKNKDNPPEIEIVDTSKGTDSLTETDSPSNSEKSETLVPVDLL